MQLRKRSSRAPRTAVPLHPLLRLLRALVSEAFWSVRTHAEEQSEQYDVRILDVGTSLNCRHSSTSRGADRHPCLMNQVLSSA